MKKCISCGAEVADETKFCPSCGHAIEAVEETPKAEPSPAPVSEAPAEKKGKVWANILCVFTLIFGIFSTCMGGLCWIPVLGLAVAVPALVLAFVGLAGSIVSCIFSSKRGVCVTGIVFSSIGLIPSLIRVIMLFAYAAAAGDASGSSALLF